MVRLVVIVLRILHVVMALLFALSFAVQYNDPDALPWMMIYAAAFILAVAGAAGRPPSWQAALVATFAFAWGLALYPAVPVFLHSDVSTTFYMHTGNDVEEEARECGGLAIVVVWSVVTIVDSNIRRRRSSRA